jgi:DnaJ-class molecular chaperone
MLLFIVLFSINFGEKQNQKSKSARAYTDNLVILWIEEIEAITGAVVETTVSRRVKCPECDGFFHYYK